MYGNGHNKANLLRIMDSAKNEREIQPHLKNNPMLVRNAFNAWAWNFTAVLSEFQLGSTYRVDFVVIGADSGRWNVSVVELKSHKERPFTNKGIYSKALNVALAQIQDRAYWIEANQTTFRQSLSEYFRDHDVSAQCSNADDHVMATTEIIDLRTPINYKYTVVIGRREMISKDYQVRRQMTGAVSVQVVTYDKLLDVAKKLDRAQG